MLDQRHNLQEDAGNASFGTPVDNGNVARDQIRMVP
jgi:hypothetical protein